MRVSSERGVLVVALVLASVAIHLLLWPLGDQLLRLGGGGGPAIAPPRALQIELLPADEPEPAATPDGQLVQLDRVENERAPEEPTPYLSEFDNRVRDQTRAPLQRPEPGPGRTQGQRSRERPSAPAAGAQGQDAPEQDPRPANEGDLSTPEPDGELPSQSRAAPGLAPLGPASTRNALRQSLGRPGSFDPISRDIDEGDETQLNSRRSRFASFFNRVRDAVAERWHPEVIHAARDPEGRIHGTRTRHTRLIISLNPDGSLHRVRVDAPCGVDYLDEEAIRAVRAAAPFVNPPAGLVDPGSNLIEFAFGFTFEFRGARRIFRYQR